MRYLSSFHRRLRYLRDEQHLSEGDVAEVCGVDEQVVRLWESPDAGQRGFPTVDQLLTLCFRTHTPLERLLDVEPDGGNDQLELPGLSVDESDLGKALDELQRQIGRWLPDTQERELLRRFRMADAENQRLILQLLT